MTSWQVLLLKVSLIALGIGSTWPEFFSPRVAVVWGAFHGGLPGLLLVAAIGHRT
jgi:hypothetical protein